MPHPQRSFGGLPDDLKFNIVGLLYQTADIWLEGGYQTSPGDVLIPLSRTSRAWRNMTLPYVFLKVNLFEETNDAITRYLTLVAPRYGHYCHSLGICLRPHCASSLSASDEITQLGRFEEKEWQVKRNALFFAMSQFMPNLEEVMIIVNDCFWHRGRQPCGCLTAYALTIESLANCALRSINIDFDIARFSQHGCDDIVANLLIGAQETIEVVYLFRGEPQRKATGRDFELTGALNILGALPRLRELRLLGVCSLAHLSDRTWASPLHTLHVYPDRKTRKLGDKEVAAHNDNVSPVFKSLPNTLRYLELGQWDYEDPFKYLSSAPPSNLANLESLTLRFPVTRAVLDYFQASKLLTLNLTSDFNLPAVSQVLKDNTMFPYLKMFQVWHPTGCWGAQGPVDKETAERLLTDACRMRDITIKFGP